jgi:hypothetical protein
VRVENVFALQRPRLASCALPDFFRSLFRRWFWTLKDHHSLPGFGSKQKGHRNQEELASMPFDIYLVRPASLCSFSPAAAWAAASRAVSTRNGEQET